MTSDGLVTWDGTDYLIMAAAPVLFFVLMWVDEKVTARIRRRREHGPRREMNKNRGL